MRPQIAFLQISLEKTITNTGNVIAIKDMFIAAVVEWPAIYIKVLNSDTPRIDDTIR
ncbi:MAG: hypothetical protein QM500_13610 [Methylococcales bacterium]